MTITLAAHFRLRCNYCSSYTAQSFRPRARTVVCHTCRSHLGTPPCPSCAGRNTPSHQPKSGRWRCLRCQCTFTYRNSPTRAQKRRLKGRKVSSLTSSCSSISRHEDDEEDHECGVIVLPPLPQSVLFAKQSELDNSVRYAIDDLDMASEYLACFFKQEISLQQASDVVGNAILSVSAVDYRTIILAEELNAFSILRKQQLYSYIKTLLKRLFLVANLDQECQNLFNAVTKLLELPLVQAAINDKTDDYPAANNQTDSISSCSLKSSQELESSTSETDFRSTAAPKFRFYVHQHRDVILVE